MAAHRGRGGTARADARYRYDPKGRFVLHRITPEEGSYKLGRVVNLKLGEKGIPCVTLHDGRTIRYPDPLIKVSGRARARPVPRPSAPPRRVRSGAVPRPSLRTGPDPPPRRRPNRSMTLCFSILLPTRSRTVSSPPFPPIPVRSAARAGLGLTGRQQS